MSITLRTPAEQSRRIGAIGGTAGLATSGLVALALTTTDYAPFAWACVAVSGLAGWALATLPVGPRRPFALFLSAIAFGAIVGFGGVLVYVLVAQFAALLPGSDVARPETPFGYVLFLLLSVLTLGPFASVPLAAVGLVWASIVRAATRDRQQA